MERSERRAVELVEYAKERHAGLVEDVESHFEHLHAVLEERKRALLKQAREYHSSQLLVPLTDVVANMNNTISRGHQLYDTLSRAAAAESGRDDPRRMSSLEQRVVEWRDMWFGAAARTREALTSKRIARRFPGLEVCELPPPTANSWARLRTDTTESTRVCTGLHEISSLLEAELARTPAQSSVQRTPPGRVSNQRTPQRQDTGDLWRAAEEARQWPPQPRKSQDRAEEGKTPQHRQQAAGFPVRHSSEMKPGDVTIDSGVSTHSGGVSAQPTPNTPPSAMSRGLPEQPTLHRDTSKRSLASTAPPGADFDDGSWETGKGCTGNKYQRPAIVPKLNLDLVNNRSKAR